MSMMRLLLLDEFEELRLEDFEPDDIPEYAILSHTWGRRDEEVTFRDLTEGSKQTKSGYKKLRFCAKRAARDRLEYSWVDSCCIKKSDSQEVKTAIISMFQWYQNATKCYVYLSDVSISSWQQDLPRSRWFTRGWTLQELLAPRKVEFFSKEGKKIGDKRSLERQIHQITGIPIQALRGTPLSNFTVHQRLSWARHRQTKLPEDKAYSLLGIFGISMGIRYGEGKELAFNRLLGKIRKYPQRVSEDNSLTPDDDSSTPDDDSSTPDDDSSTSDDDSSTSDDDSSTSDDDYLTSDDD